jgi:alcohol dehydrogenase
MAIAEAMGETVSGLSSAEVVMRTVQAVVNLMKKVQCPMSLSQLGIPRTEIPSIAQEMLKIKRLMIHNPRPVTESQAVEIVGNMWEGKAA